MSLVFVTLAIFLLLCISEYSWRRKILTGELGRKFVHITVGSFVAFWPFFLSWNQIRLMSLAFLVVVAVSKYFKLFKVIHTVHRPTYGEVFFALVVGLLTFVTKSKGIYAAAILQMSLADGLAAVIGTKFGRGNHYKVLGHTKSIAGTGAFMFTSAVILIGYGSFETNGLAGIFVVIGAVTAAGLENIASFGIDNLIVPLFVALLLSNV